MRVLIWHQPVEPCSSHYDSAPSSAPQTHLGGGAVFSLVFGWSRAAIIKKVFCPDRPPIHSPLEKENGLLSVRVSSVGAQASPAPHQGYTRSKKKTQRSHCHVIPQVLKCLACPPSFHLSVFPSVCLLYHIQRFLVVRGWAIPSWPEGKSLLVDSLLSFHTSQTHLFYAPDQ